MNYKSILFCHTVLNAPQSTSTRQWPMANGRMAMAINDEYLKMPRSEGLKCNGGSRFPHLPDGDCAAILLLLSSLSLSTLTNSYLPRQIPRPTQEKGKNHR